MKPRAIKQFEAILTETGDGATFTPAEIEGLPLPVQRHLSSAIAPGTPLAVSARLVMRGSIKIGRWIPFRAMQLLSPHRGFVWAATVAGLIFGSDHYVEGQGALDWKLAGLIRVMHAEGPDVSRSSAERAAAEAVWLPSTLLPRFGVTWSATNESHLSASYEIEGKPIHVHYELGSDGRLRSLAFDRWGDPDDTGTWGLHRFGGVIIGHATFDGMTIPASGRMGWRYGTDQWEKGEFFRYRITDLRPI